jgi:5-methylcytosine-specific restriction protein B
MAFINEMLQLFFSNKISIEDFKTENRDALREKFNTQWDKYLFGYDSMYKGIIEYVNNKNQASDSHKKVIIIDEINRGNISNIFGELITLIEEDKRIGSQNYTPVKLPYSKELFGVPNNLFIIGTMNTADRSVEALDTALRRRFSFIEMNPEPAKLSTVEFKCAGIDLETLLSAINNRIEKLLDKDYCIGHSYFMTIKNRQSPLEEIKIIFQNKILPLLQEYFYGDWGKILLVIGKEFVETKENTIKFLSTDSYENFEEYDEKPIYNFTKPSSWTIKSFKSIYE